MSQTENARFIKATAWCGSVSNKLVMGHTLVDSVKRVLPRDGLAERNVVLAALRCGWREIAKV